MPKSKSSASGTDHFLTPKKQKLTKVTSLDCLPEEILVQISSYLYQEDAVSLLLTAKAFAKPAKMRLYSKILICEKHQDTYFYHLSRRNKITLLSSWDNILAFFKSIYLRTQTGTLKDTDVVHYIEYIASYGYLDTGKVDVHRYITPLDFQRILSLRQYWDTVFNSFNNLRSFVFPRMPFDRVIFLNKGIQSQLVELGINVDCREYDEDQSEVFQSLLDRIELPNLKKLIINLHQPEQIVSGAMGKLLLSLLQPDKSQKTNSMLESLEINGSFGVSDRHLEHNLRHHDFSQDVNLKSSFLRGFRIGENMYRNGAAFSGIVADLEDAGTLRIVQDVESDDDDDELYQSLARQDEHSIDPSTQIALELEDDDLDPILHRVDFIGDTYQGYDCNSNSECHNQLLVELDNVGFQITNLRRLSLADLNSVYLDTSIAFQQRLRRVITHWESLQVLNLQNCHVQILENYQHENMTTLQSKSLLKFFTDDLPITNLKSLCYSFDTLDNNISDDGMQTLVENLESYNMAKLSTLIHKNEDLKYFKYVATKSSNLRDLYQILKTSEPAKLEHITYLKPTEILSLCRRLLNTKIFKRFKNFNDLVTIDDYFFGASKQLIEHFNTCARVDEYYGDNDDYKSCTLGYDKKFLFNSEFEYLFKEEVVQFFKLLPSLKTFTHFGYTFHRKNLC